MIQPEQTVITEQQGQGKQAEQDCQHITVTTVLLGQDI
jgi:hypothetical protein